MYGSANGQSQSSLIERYNKRRLNLQARPDLDAERGAVDQNLHHTGAADEFAALRIRRALVIVLHFHCACEPFCISEDSQSLSPVPQPVLAAAMLAYCVAAGLLCCYCGG